VKQGGRQKKKKWKLPFVLPARKKKYRLLEKGMRGNEKKRQKKRTVFEEFPKKGRKGEGRVG